MASVASPTNVTHIAARQFRNYSLLDLPISPTWNILLGPNGAGKTNILELLTLTMRRLVFRGRTMDAVMWGKDDAELRTTVSPSTHIQMLIRRTESGADRVLTINDEQATVVPENLIPPLILFLPHEDALLSTPAGRRKLFSRSLLLRSARYAEAMRRYQLALRQRNALLRSGFRHDSEMSVWTDALLDPLRIIWQERRELVEEMNTHLPTILTRLGGVHHNVHVALRPGGFSHDHLPSAEEIRTQFNRMREREIDQRTTLIGAHRDRILFSRNKQDVVELLSRGQRRILLLAIHLLGGMVMEKQGRTPLYLFDDVMSELDDEHRRAIFSALDRAHVILTTADEHILNLVPQDASVYRVHHGTVEMI